MEMNGHTYTADSVDENYQYSTVTNKQTSTKPLLIYNEVF